jgi:hypothetical protein
MKQSQTRYGPVSACDTHCLTDLCTSAAVSQIRAAPFHFTGAPIFYRSCFFSVLGMYVFGLDFHIMSEPAERGARSEALVHLNASVRLSSFDSLPMKPSKFSSLPTRRSELS